MKLTNLATLLVLGLAVAVATTGCRKQPRPLTVLPGNKAGQVGDMNPGNPLGNEGTGTGTNVGSEGIPAVSPDKFANYSRNAEIFKQDTVYFDYDSSAVRKSEAAKVGNVADYLKSHTAEALSIEGHCDERGTEEYNRALGERRALALREELVKSGVAADRMQTISFGKDRPADLGTSDAAHRKNRRGEFILLTPPAAP
jgi:peptidoglycan-associated lipoprotein